ncbi:unnamed protein product [Schistocephalus solidus]|uniref:N-acetylgalactosaminide beta-1,3-galactosyltransferase n=1 Tax=Schistocephalus solidus TaxID=70667 RepID=A0A183S7Z6_SCHSO|nr:unnamed protein product [Schistocephalus solidus]
MRKKIRLFAFIVTTSKYAKQKSAYIKATWARRIERFLFLSNEDDSSLPAIKIVGEDKEQTSFQKVLAGLLFAYRHNLTYFDYFIKTEDDAYVVPENLRFLLRSFDSNDPLMMGHSNEAKGDVSDRVAYVLSRGAVTAVAKGFINNVPACRNSKLREDVAMGKPKTICYIAFFFLR